MQKGDIALVYFPFSDLKSAKLRPAVVLIPEDKYDDVCLAFITSKILDDDDVIVIKESDKNFKETGLKLSSSVRLRKIVTVEKRLIVGSLGRLPVSHIKRLDKVLAVLFKLDN